MIRFGIDLGGTKTELAALDPGGSIVLRRRIATPAGDYGQALESLARLVADAERELGVSATVGLGHPGAIDPSTGCLHNAFATVFNDRPFAADLARILARETRLENDANCFALSEALDGAGAGCRVVFGAILGTGAGAGIVVEGRLLRGAKGLAGEWGHNPLPWMKPDEYPGPECACGRRGCIERFISGPALAEDFERATGRRLLPAEIASAAQAEDPECRDCLDRHADRVGRALASAINLLDPDVIVLGGGLSRLERLAADLPRRVAPHTYGGHCPPIRQAAHGDSSGVRGAAMLWPA
jgi:fructokinase